MHTKFIKLSLEKKIIYKRTQIKQLMKKASISIEKLKKTYQNNVHALRGISLEIKEGDFFALLGPNGAGKSTTIGILTSLVRKTSGKVKIFGIDIDKDFDAAKKFIGVVPQEFNFGIFEKVEDIIVTQAGYYGVPYKEAKKRAGKYLKELRLWNKRKKKAMHLSGGMKRRLMIARALVHEPKLLILDEPTAGVDIELRTSMWKYLKKINEEGVTIILTTHYLEEAEAMCKSIAIIDDGRIVVNTSTKSLIRKANTQTILVDTKDPIDKISKMKDCKCKLIDPHTIEITFSKKITLNHVFEYLNTRGIQIVSMRNRRNRLEELFLKLTGGASK